MAMGPAKATSATNTRNATLRPLIATPYVDVSSLAVTSPFACAELLRSSASCHDFRRDHGLVTTGTSSRPISADWARDVTNQLRQPASPIPASQDHLRRDPRPYLWLDIGLLNKCGSHRRSLPWRCQGLPQSPSRRGRVNHRRRCTQRGRDSKPSSKENNIDSARLAS